MTRAVLTREDLTVAVQRHLAAQTELLAAEEEHARVALRATDARFALKAELEARRQDRVVVAGHLVELTDKSVSVTSIEVLP